MSQNETLAALSAAGVSVWLDDLSRDRLNSGNLAELRDTKSVVGVTTNPSIFQAALSTGHAYDAQMAELAERGADVEATIRTVTTDDVREACDLFAEVYTATGGVDGRVSIEVDPRLARDTDKTILQAMELWKIVDRPNVLIKIPATEAGLPAITAVIGEGISVNVPRARITRLHAAAHRRVPQQLLDEERFAFYQSVAAFAEAEVAPKLLDWERKAILLPDAIIGRMAALGLFGVPIEAEYGGQGGGQLELVLMGLALGYHSHSVAITPGAAPRRSTASDPSSSARGSEEGAASGPRSLAAGCSWSLGSPSRAADRMRRTPRPPPPGRRVVS